MLFWKSVVWSVMLFSVTIFSTVCSVVLFWEQCALFPCFLWQAGLPPPLYGGIGEVRVLIGNPRRPIWSRCTVSCIIGRPIWSLPGLLATSSSTPSRSIIIVVNLHSAFYPRNLQSHPGGTPVLKRVQLHRLSRIIWTQPYMKLANSFVIVDVMMIKCAGQYLQLM